MNWKKNFVNFIMKCNNMDLLRERLIADYLDVYGKDHINTIKSVRAISGSSLVRVKYVTINGEEKEDNIEMFDLISFIYSEMRKPMERFEEYV